MNCRSCIHARRAGNAKMIGCRYWTGIYRGDKTIVTLALKEIVRRKNLEMDLEMKSIGIECISGLIDTLIMEYAPKPIFEGWADLEQPYTDNDTDATMTNDCVVLDPGRLCSFYTNPAEIIQ
jgi:hypothetical protein